MNAASRNDVSIAPATLVSRSTAIAIALSVATAWTAAGSCGNLADPLRHALVCLLLVATIFVGWPTSTREWIGWMIFAGGITAACVMALLPINAVNVLSVVVVLSTLAYFRAGLDGRAMLLASLAILGFAVCRFLYADCPQFWFLGDRLGQSLGWIVGKHEGRPFSLGATFGCVDLMVLMGFLYGFWLSATASPRKTRAIFAIAGIAATQLAYTSLLSYSEKFAANLIPVYPVEDDYMRMGAWVWQNSLRSLIPWNVPILAVVMQSILVAAMFRFAKWRQLVSGMPSASAKGKPAPKVEPAEFIPTSGMLFRYGSAGAALLLAGFAMFWTSKPDFDGKIILAYQSRDVRWTVSSQGESGENGYGLLPDFIESLGGKMLLSKTLAPEELAKADAVLLLNPDERFSPEIQARLDDYLERGGSVLTALDRDSSKTTRKKLNEFLEPAGVRIEEEIAQSRTKDWEQALQAMNHPVVLGIHDSRNDFGLQSCSALRLRGPAVPMLTGKWGWSASRDSNAVATPTSFRFGDRLGDVVLLAESKWGNGKIVVLGDMNPLSNDAISDSYEFAGRLLGYAVRKTEAFPWWRTAGMLLCASTLLVLIVLMRNASQPIVAAVAFAVAMLVCRFVVQTEQRIVPQETAKSPRRIAMIDASHLEAYSDQAWHPIPSVPEYQGEIGFDQGLGNFTRTLAANGFLPLKMKHFSLSELLQARVFFAIAPGRSYSPVEIDLLREYVEFGGTLICMAGAEESRAINPLLKAFDLRVPPTPVPPSESKTTEPAPKGSIQIRFTKPESEKDGVVHFYVAWEIESLAIGNEGEEVQHQIYRSVENSEDWFIVSRNIGHGGGKVIVIADTFFAANENPDPGLNGYADQEGFWAWFLSRMVSEKMNGQADIPKEPANLPNNDDTMREGGVDEE